MVGSCSVKALTESAASPNVTAADNLVENYPGFVTMTGSELGDRLVEQAMAQGAEFELDKYYFFSAGNFCAP